MGQIEIGYRETILQPSQRMTKIFDKETAGHRGKAGCTAVVEPCNMSDPQSTEHAPPQAPEAWTQDRNGNLVTILTPNFDSDSEAISFEDLELNPNISLSEIRNAYLNGALAALSRGPGKSYQVRNVHVTLTLKPSEHIFGAASTLSALSAAARFATVAALKDAAAKGGTSLMEPVMDVTISIDEASLGPVVHDISSNRGGHVISLDEEDTISQEPGAREGKLAIDSRKVYAPPDPFGPSGVVQDDGFASNMNRPRMIRARVPLKEMIGYLKHLRSITGGRGTFVMSVDGFERMSGQREKALLSGFPG